MIANDDSTTTEQLSSYFHRLGYETTAISTRSQLLEFTRTEVYSTIVLDTQFAESDTAELIRCIRADSAVRSTIVVMTALDLEGMERRYLEAGADKYLVKPIEPPHLESMLTWGSHYKVDSTEPNL